MFIKRTVILEIDLPLNYKAAKSMFDLLTQNIQWLHVCYVLSKHLLNISWILSAISFCEAQSMALILKLRVRRAKTQDFFDFST